MCGIIGFTGNAAAGPYLLGGLEKLTYRGYDSSGIAYFKDDQPQFEIRRQTGRVSDLKKICDPDETSSCGIGHNRWATHGGVTTANAHPHHIGDVALIHNGIIENYRELILKYGLQEKLAGETDTEAAAALLDLFYQKSFGDPFTAIAGMTEQLKGTFAFCILFRDHPGEIYCIRRVSPLLAGRAEGIGCFAASDLTAFLEYTNRYFIIPELHILKITKNSFTLRNLSGSEISPCFETASWNISAVQKNGYPHFMLKEIHEQPDVLEQTILPRIAGGVADFLTDGIPDSLFKGCTDITVIGCGTAMHAGLAAKCLIQKTLGIPVTVTEASEFRYERPLITGTTLVIAISQSGETIDTLEALRLASRYSCRTLSVVNVKGSSISRESRYVLYTHGGPEIAVASTKAYTVQLAALYLISCRLALVSHLWSTDQARRFIQELSAVPEKIRLTLQQEATIISAAETIASQKNIFYIGRGMDHALAREAALKLKEISYIHAEAYAAGELKHGTIALVEKGVPVIAVSSQKDVFSKMISNIQEVRSRGAYTLLFTTYPSADRKAACDTLIPLPEVSDLFSIFEAAAAMQLLAYHTAVIKDLDPDLPRNLAKSVTVE